MTALEYLSYLKANKGILFGDETRLDDLQPEDRSTLIRHGYILLDDDHEGTPWVELTKSGEDFLLSVY